MTRDPRKDVELRRRRPIRQAYGRILLLFEDSKVAPAYFGDLRAVFGLHPQNVVTEKPVKHGNDPVGVVRAGIAAAKIKDDFDGVYCLVDRDRHTNLDQARNIARDDKSGKLCLIVSDPCFEVWILAHFTGSTRPLKNAGVQEGSDCAEVIAAIRGYWPAYTKGQANLFADTESKLDQAKTNAKRWKAHHDASSGDGNPSTGIVDLIEHLENLRADRRRAG